MAQIKDRTGQRFGRLVALRCCGVGNDGALWECICDCGKITWVRGTCLARGTTQSCRCLEMESRLKHGQRGTPEYRSWAAAKTRCYNPAYSKYPRYGGRGIVMCERWRDSFARFFEDMGRRPSKRHTLDRRNNDGNYEPGNCRWATPKQQAKNKTHGRSLRKLTDHQILEIREQLKSNSCRSLAPIYGVSRTSITNIARGKTWKHIKERHIKSGNPTDSTTIVAGTWQDGRARGAVSSKPASAPRTSSSRMDSSTSSTAARSGR